MSDDSTHAHVAVLRFATPQPAAAIDMDKVRQIISESRFMPGFGGGSEEVFVSMLGALVGEIDRLSARVEALESRMKARNL